MSLKATVLSGKRKVSGILGVLGCVVCIASMIVAVVGAVGVGAAAAGNSMGMADMGSMGSTSSGQSSAFLRFLLDYGQPIFLVSVALVVFSIGIKQKAASVTVLLFGFLMYWGMYLQSSLFIMYITILLGFLMWGVIYARVFKLGKAMRSIRSEF